jgi:hypothetical protein
MLALDISPVSSIFLSLSPTFVVTPVTLVTSAEGPY